LFSILLLRYECKISFLCIHFYASVPGVNKILRKLGDTSILYVAKGRFEGDFIPNNHRYWQPRHII